MAKYKYQLLQTDREKLNVHKYLKLCAICGIFLFIVYYKSSSSASPAINQTFYMSNLDMEPSSDQQEQTDLTTIGMTSTHVLEKLNTTLNPIATMDPIILENYFVFTSGCHMPALNPFSKDAMRIFSKTPYQSCASGKDLITSLYIEQQRRYKLHINQPDTTCCYRVIERTGSGDEADNNYKLWACRDFQQDFLVPQYATAAITECRQTKTKKFLQRDAFGFVQPKPTKDNQTEQITNDKETIKKRKPSILLWGIDSMSRMNFQRTMPLMYQYLREQNWYELQGYNKMGDNTFPNLLAILTGFNSTRSQSVCRPKVVGGLDSCPLIWKTFQARDYVTAYAEDWGRFSTFNYNKKGFLKPPTDHYPRSLMLAVEKELKKELVSGIPYCVGRRHYAEYIYDSAIQFTRVYKNQSSFGMFWTNSFSHNNFALPSSMDKKIVEYMRTLQQEGTFNNSIIVFFSDHGMRFGPLRSLDSGFLEERMPIMYIWLPVWFRKEYPKFAANLQLNRNRLTSPYDIYATLQHVLELGTPFEQLPRPEGCPNCHSIFYEVAESRDCNEAGIDDHWCSCSSFKYDSPSNKHIKDVTQQLIDATNQYLEGNNYTDFCQALTLTNIESAQKKHSAKAKTLESFLIRYEVEPMKALFEASVYWNKKTQQISVNVPDISRLDSYSVVSQCIEDVVAKKFCICFDDLLEVTNVTSNFGHN